MIQISHVSKAFLLQTQEKSYTKKALDDVSFTVSDGETLVIGGANGSGKSLLMSIISGLDSPDSGSVSVSDKSGRPAKCGLVFQDADSQILGETPLEDVMFGLKSAGIPKKEARIQALHALEQVGLADKAEYTARFMSGGEKRRLSVAGILALNRDTLIFDEPYANLDYAGVVQVNQLLEMLKASGKTLLVLTHELEKCLGLADRFLVLFEGHKVFDGTPAQGLEQNLEKWSIRNPLAAYKNLEDLVWRK